MAQEDAVVITGKAIITLLFNSGQVLFSTDSRENGLYLCGPATAAHTQIVRLREFGVWRGETKEIPPESKAVYIEQILFEECFAAGPESSGLIVVRAAHPRYPVDEDTWNRWREVLHHG